MTAPVEAFPSVLRRDPAGEASTAYLATQEGAAVPAKGRRAAGASLVAASGSTAGGRADGEGPPRRGWGRGCTGVDVWMVAGLP